MATTYEPIATTTLNSNVSDITFSSIPNTYTDLKLVIVPLTQYQGNYIWLRFNDDSGTNYARNFQYGAGTSVGGAVGTADAQLRLNFVTPSVGTPSLCTAEVFSYAGSTHKSILYSSADDNNGSGYIVRGVGLWKSTSAITKMVITTDGGTLNSGTVATLYGIKAA